MLLFVILIETTPEKLVKWMDALFVVQKLGFKLHDMENEKANHIADVSSRAEVDLEDAAVVIVCRGIHDPPRHDAHVIGEDAPALEALEGEAAAHPPVVLEGEVHEGEKWLDLHPGVLAGVHPPGNESIAENPQRNPTRKPPAQKPNREALEADLLRNPS